MAGKKDVAKLLADDYNMSQRLAEEITAKVFAGVLEVLKTGDDLVNIRGFGTFRMKDFAARLARNPKTGEAIRVAAKTAVRFKASKLI